MCRRRQNRGDRDGSVTFEALLVLPILLVVVLGLVEFAMVLTAEQKLAEASSLAARAGSTGRSDEDVKEAANAVFGTKQRAQTTVNIKRWDDPHTGPMIEVRVDLPAKAASMNLLRSVGFDLSGDTLTGRTVMRVE